MRRTWKAQPGERVINTEPLSKCSVCMIRGPLMEPAVRVVHFSATRLRKVHIDFLVQMYHRCINEIEHLDSYSNTHPGFINDGRLSWRAITDVIY